MKPVVVLRRVRVGLAVGLLSLVAIACEAKRSQIMLGIITDFQAPSPLSSVQLQVYNLDRADQLPVIENTWQLSGVAGDPFELPGSFALYGDESDQLPRMRIVLTGRDRGNQPLLQRVSIVRVVKEQTLFMRMALVGTCMGNADCAESLTCVEGRCRAPEINSAILPNYAQAMESSVNCASGPTYVNTGTRAALPLAGTGTCTSNEFCEEATCYRKLSDVAVAVGPRRVGESCSAEQACEPGAVCFNQFCVGTGFLRISLAFTADSDFDLHLLTPTGSEISWSVTEADGGELDVDQCISACGSEQHVENIVFRTAAPSGTYQVWVENLDGRAAGDFTIDVAGRVTQRFSGRLPMSGGSDSERFSFVVP